MQDDKQLEHFKSLRTLVESSSQEDPPANIEDQQTFQLSSQRYPQFFIKPYIHLQTASSGSIFCGECTGS